MKKRQRLIRVLGIFSVFIFFLTSGCSDDGGVVTPTEGGTTTTTIIGFVVNETGQPLAGVTLKSHGQTATSGASGEYSFSNITVPAGRLFVNAERSGYFNASRGEIPRPAGTTEIIITMMQKTVTHTINSTTGGNADLPNGSKIEIQPNSIVTSNGSTYNGTVNMSVVYMDPTTVSFSNTVSGGDLIAKRSDSSEVSLYSYGILKVILEDGTGQPLQIGNGNTSTITSTIPASMVSSAPQSIPLWFFDEGMGIWREEGSANKVGDKYVGTVSHFTDWNCDGPGSTTRVQGNVVDCNNHPMAGLVIKVGQGTTRTDENGNFFRNVPSDVQFNVSIEASQNFGISGSPVSVGPLSANQTFTVPQYNLACYPVIKGKYKDCNGNVLAGIVSAAWDNMTQGLSPSGANGFRMYVEANKQINLKFVSYNGVVKDTVIQSPLTATELDLGDISTCGLTQGENSFTINGAGFNNVNVVFTPQVAIGYYMISENSSAISIIGQNSDFFAFFFPGNTTGSFTNQNGHMSYQSVILTADGTLSVVVTEYGNVGGVIKGTFEGEFDTSNGPATISNGKFFVVRQPDQN